MTMYPDTVAYLGTDNVLAHAKHPKLIVVVAFDRGEDGEAVNSRQVSCDIFRRSVFKIRSIFART